MEIKKLNTAFLIGEFYFVNPEDVNDISFHSIAEHSEDHYKIVRGSILTAPNPDCYQLIFDMPAIQDLPRCSFKGFIYPADKTILGNINMTKPIVKKLVVK